MWLVLAVSAAFTLHIAGISKQNISKAFARNPGNLSVDASGDTLATNNSSGHVATTNASGNVSGNDSGRDNEASSFDSGNGVVSRPSRRVGTTDEMNHTEMT